MKRFLFIGALFVCECAFSQEVQKGLLAQKEHVVVKNDTLWDIAGKYYSDPFKWGKIYNANLEMIKNPDLIYPGEKLAIPGLTERIKPTEEQEEKRKELMQEGGEEELEIKMVAPKAAPVKKAEAKGQLSSEEVLAKKTVKTTIPELSENMPPEQSEWNEMLDTEIVPKDWKAEAFVEGKEGGFEDSLIFKGDILKLKLKFKTKVKVGDFAAVYKKGDKVRNKKGKIVGIKVQKIAECRVIEVDSRNARAIVIKANSAVMKGLSVKFQK